MSATRAVYVMTSNEHVIFFPHSPDGLRAAQRFREFCTMCRLRFCHTSRGTNEHAQAETAASPRRRAYRVIN